MKLGVFNLIYGRNEKGKTLLVEFLIRSLFKNPKLWALRPGRGSGKVLVDGLGEKIVEFKPASEYKMEDFWEKEASGLPPDFSKLLVVKGAEVELADRTVGIDKAVLKCYLSSQEVLDEIDSQILKTVGEMKVEKGVLVGYEKAEIVKSRKEFEKTIQELDQLFVQLDRGYSAGQRMLLSDEREKLEVELGQLGKGKRYLAYELDRAIRELEGKKNRIPEEKLQEARENFRLAQHKSQEICRKEKEQKETEERSKHYGWLENANKIYERWMGREVRKPKPLFLILSILLIVLAGVFGILGIPVGVVVALLGVVLFGVLYLQRIHSLTGRTSENEEIKKLENEFQGRVGQKLTGLPVIQELLQRMAEDYNTAKVLKKQLVDDRRDFEILKAKISDRLFELVGESRPFEASEDELVELGARLRELTERIQEKKDRLSRLDVDPSDYVTEKPDVTYSKQTYDELQERLEHITNQISEETQKLDTLKHLICQQTGDDITVDWETVIQHLRSKREEVVNTYKQKTAEILGKIAVHQVLEELRKDEDTKIVEGLKSESVLAPLRKMTGDNYNDLKLAGERLVVSSSTNDFSLSELSTGAQEQVLLALRIGFAQRLTKQDEPLFLILDDAFQYSDWERRGWLMDAIVELAKAGWQIIYFTMDDHIRDLFRSKGRVFGDNFKMKELN